VKSSGLILLLVLTLLQGCNHGGSAGGSSAGPGNVRLINASTAYASLDMTLTSNGTVLASGIASGGTSSYTALGPGTFPVALLQTGTSTPLAQVSPSIPSAGYLTLVAYDSGQQLQVWGMLENQAAPPTGSGSVRVTNLGQADTGNVDVYIAGAAGGTLATASTLTANQYFNLPAGTYHIWVTGVGDKTDLRLDMPSVAISDQQVQTLFLTSTTGGMLVNGWLVTQLGTVSVQTNASARVRVAANIDYNGTVAATVNSVSLGSSPLRSPFVGSYALVSAGALSISALVNGATVSVPTNLTAAAGTNVTLLAIGNGASPQFYLINEDNRTPPGGKARLRLVNGVTGITGNISLTANFNLVAQDIALGKVSTAASLDSGTISQLVVTASGTNTTLGTALTDVNLQSQGVYSVFVLGNNAAPVVQLYSAR
jgi:hypothetical protein